MLGTSSGGLWSVRCVHTAVSKAKDFISDLEFLDLVTGLRSEFFDHAGILDPQRFGYVWCQGVFPIALTNIHAIQSKSFNANQGRGASGTGFGSLVIDVQCSGRNRTRTLGCMNVW